MTEDNLRVGKGARQIERLGELMRIDLQIETEVVSLEQRESAAPVRAREQVWRRRQPQSRISMPVENVANAAKVFRLRVRLDHLCRAGFMQRDLGHDCVRKPGLVG